METRTAITHKIEPEGGTDGELPLHFALVRHTEQEARRSQREIWRQDSEHPQPVLDEKLTVLGRRELSDLLALGADWLAYNPATDD
jgi:hypothetical protein